MTSPMTGPATAGLIAPRPPPALPARRPGGSRLLALLLLAAWAGFAAGLVALVISGWDEAKFLRYGPRYLNGLWTTVSLVTLSVLLGALLSLPVALARQSSRRFLAWPAYAYVYVFRSTPLLAQLFLIYYGLGGFRAQFEAVGLWWLFRDAWYCGLLSLTLNTAAYQAEILRGAIESVPAGQREAAAALGLPQRIAFRKIILPQALIVALRPYGNEIVLMIKGSAAVAIITVYDLMGETRYAFSRSFDYQTYLWAAILYLAIVETLRHVFGWIEARLTRHLRR